MVHIVEVAGSHAAGRIGGFLTLIEMAVAERSILVPHRTTSGLSASEERRDVQQWIQEQAQFSRKRLALERQTAQELFKRLQNAATAAWLTDAGWPTPSPVTTARARQVIYEISATYPHVLPHLVTSPDGEVVFEWWYDQRKVTLYVSDDSLFFVKSWGADMSAEMEDGSVPTVSSVPELVAWLING